MEVEWAAWTGSNALTVVVFARPWTTNSERAGNRFARQAKVKLWRGWFRGIAEQVNAGTWTDATVRVGLQLKGQLQDTAACNPAVKAAIDGLVDGKVFFNDTGDHVREITFVAPVRDKQDALWLTIEGRKCAVGD